MRTIIDLPEPDCQQLDALWLEHQQLSHAAVLGLWSDRPCDALSLQDALRQGWSQP